MRRRLRQGGEAGMTSNGDSSTTVIPDDEKVRDAAREARSGMGGRMGGAGVPTERSDDFGATTRRLMASMHPERLGLWLVIVLALVSVTLTVLGPKVLGHATDIVVQGVFGPGADGIDFGELHK